MFVSREYAIMDNQGIIEDFDYEEDALNSIERVRKENRDIRGDLLVIKILAREK